MANLSMSTTDDCRFLQGQYSSSILGPATLVVSNNGNEVATYELSVTQDFADVAMFQTFVYSVEDVIGSDPGVITATFTDFEGNVTTAGTLSSCFLDCCLADKTLQLTSCNCGEPQCDRTLVEAQRIFLLIQSINTILANIPTDATLGTGIIDKAIDAYNSAKNQCISFCGCNC